MGSLCQSAYRRNTSPKDWTADLSACVLVDIDKGRSRSPPTTAHVLVAKHYSQERRDDDLYAATPPIESLRNRGIGRHHWQTKEKAIMVNDVSTAYFYAPCEEEIYVETLQGGIRAWGREAVWQNLSKPMNGTRTAARMWQREVNQDTHRRPGFTAGSQITVLVSIIVLEM